MTGPGIFLFLYGPPGAGKSSLGTRLAGRLRLPFYDLDGLIEAGQGCTIEQIFATQGEPGFRQIESAALAELLERPPGLAALGGGSLLDAGNRARVERAGRVLCLQAGLDALTERLRASAAVRPLLAGEPVARLEKLMSQRAGHYDSFDLQLDSTRLQPEEALEAAMLELGLFWVEGMGAGYPARVLAGGLNQAGSLLRQAGLGGPLALVCDHNLAGLHAARVEDSLQAAGYTVRRVVIPAGEQHKNLTSLAALWEDFLAAGLERGSTVVALGGGVTGDLAGFAAATYLRGVAWANLPTSLLAMVDASLGGKTGIDLPQGKNLAGAFHPPALVLADPCALDTLPLAEQRSGLAEVVKHGLIGDPDLFACARVVSNRSMAHWEAGGAALDGGQDPRHPGRPVRARSAGGAQPGTYHRPRDRTGQPVPPAARRSGRDWAGGSRPAWPNGSGWPINRTGGAGGGCFASPRPAYPHPAWSGP
jgi:shikimate kinase / 3-dehydroquinate synthase